MPFYLVTVKVKHQVIRQVFRDLPEDDIEKIYTELQAACKAQYTDHLEYFDCRQYAIESEAVKFYMRTGIVAPAYVGK